MSTKKEIAKSFAPASVANVGCGFDVLGFAIHGPGDLVTATFDNHSRPGVVIKSITGDGGALPLEANKNTAGLAILAMLKKLDESSGIELSIEKRMPLGSGLGSSAASSVAAVVAVNHLLNEPFEKNDLLPFAVEGEMAASGTAHADNAAASLYGGFVLVREHIPPDVIQLSSPDQLHCTIIHPHIEIQTKNSRLILKKDVSLKKAVKQWANVGALVAGLLKDDCELIGRALQDEIIEPVRSVLIPGFSEMKQAALDAGALGCSISGSGPSLFALSTSQKTAQKIGEMMASVLKTLNLKYNIYVSKVNEQGACIVTNP